MVDSRSGKNPPKAMGAKLPGQVTPEPTQCHFGVLNSFPEIGQINARFKATRKSREGCQTCKFRKKKCDDKKPVCSDCQRLGKECVWVDYSSMNKEQIRSLRQKVQEKERNLKLRKRKKTGVSNSSIKSAIDGKSIGDGNGKIMGENSLGGRKSLNDGAGSVSLSSSSESPDKFIKNENVDMNGKYGLETGLEQGLQQGLEPGLEPGLEQGVAIGPATGPESHVKQELLYPSAAFPSPSFPSQSFPSQSFPNNSSGNSHALIKPKPSPIPNVLDHFGGADPGFDSPMVFQERSFEEPNGYSHINGYDVNHRPVSGSGPASDTGSASMDRIGSFSNFFKAANGHDSESSSAFLHFLKDLSQSNAASPKLTIQEASDPQHSDQQNLDPRVSDPQNSDPLQSSAPGPVSVFSPNETFSKLPLSPMKPVSDADISFNGMQLYDLASGFMSSYYPSPRPSLSLFPELCSRDLYLYNYYCETLSKKVSIAPSTNVDSNSYQRVFLPLAQKDKGVMYGILAWAGFHLGGKWMAEGSQYAKLAASHLNDSLGGGFIEDEAVLEAPKTPNSENEEKNGQINRRAIVNKLATLLILCGAEICRGDIKYWSVFLKWAANLLKMNGGILNFNNNKEEHWLISNFAYHDLLASSNVERGTYFPTEVYSEIFRDKAGISRGNINPLLGVSKSLFKAIGDISQLSREAKNGDIDKISGAVNDYNTTEPSALEEELEPAAGGLLPKKTDPEWRRRRFAHISLIAEKAQQLETMINGLNPESEDLENLSESDWELQLTSFEALKLTCKLYLRQAVLRTNPSSLQSRVLTSKLIDRIDALLHTSVQGALVFPIFMAGIHCVSTQERELMRQRFDDFMKSYGPWNVVRVKAVVEKVWMTNSMGDLAVDWNEMLDEMGWEVNFA